MKPDKAATHSHSCHTPSATASPWVNYYLNGINPDGHVLDVASGSGRHTRLVLETGRLVTAIDRDVSGLSDLADNSKLTILEHDLENGQPVPFAGPFDGVIVTNYLYRPILPDIIAAVGSAGVLIYETFGRGNERYGHPKNPDYLLRPGELSQAVAGYLTPLAYQHVTVSNRKKNPQNQATRVFSAICAVGPDHHWLLEPPGPLPQR